MRPDWRGGAAVAGGEVPELVEGSNPGNETPQSRSTMNT